MQRGLDIAIACWIHEQHGSDGLPALPAVSIPFELRHFSTVTTSEDLERAATLALYANRIPGSGTDYEAGAVPAYLWDRHKANIQDMIHAVAILSDEERGELARVDAILYKPDGYSISDRYALYREYRQIHQDLQLQNADPALVNSAYTDWVVMGHKAAIEEALAAKVALAKSTSRLSAAEDVTKIDIALGALGAGNEFAPTLFAPISAASTEHWSEAEVDLQALEDAMAPEVQRAAWNAYRGNKTGKVHFRYIGVDLLRSWFTASIYQADDWRLADGADGPIAAGDGHRGRLPAYYSRLYLAQILDIREVKPSRPEPSPPAPPRPSAFSKLKIQPRIAGSVRVRPVRTRALEPSRVTGAQPVMRGLKARARTTALPERARPVKRPVFKARFSHFEAKPHIALGKTGRIARIQKLDPVSVLGKVDFVKHKLGGTTASELPEDKPLYDSTTYLVGFGRTRLPACPNSNPNYLWP